MNDAVNFIVKYGSCTNIIADRTMTIIHNIQELICRSEYDNHLQSSHVEELNKIRKYENIFTEWKDVYF